MKPITLVTMLMMGGVLTPATAEDGAAIFKAKCMACHKIGGGRLVGPDLLGVTERRSVDWIRSMVSDPVGWTASDETAKGLLDTYKVQMPDPKLSAEQIQAVIAFLSKAKAGAAGPAASPLPPGDALRGGAIFSGRARLSGGGPACISCHSIKSGQVPFRGGLAKDLSDVAVRLGAAGVDGVLAGLPFPAMQETYGARKLSVKERADVLAFLAKAGQEKGGTASLARTYLLGGGGGVGVVLLVLPMLAWRRRRQRSVNQEMFDRQIRSEKGTSA